MLRAVCVLTVVWTLSGCGSQMVLNEGALDRGLVILLPGIDGRALYNEAACHALADSGVAMAVELCDWTAPLGPLFNQTAVGRNREVAGRLAERIVSYLRQHPNGQVYLIGHSGGTAIAVWAAEALPDGQRVEGIILLASSLSPGYELSAALAHTRGGIVSFYSSLDGGLLGVGTGLVGTMDGLHGPSAGLDGFQPPSSPARRDEYAKLYQIAWEPGMNAAGHDGGHFTYMVPPFISAYVGPLVKRPAWDEALIADVRTGRAR